jgi:hydroxymethylbilane synthase
LLSENHIASTLVPMNTQGDALQGPLTHLGGKGLFTKALDQALLENHIDIAVHSVKDMPSILAPNLCLAATLKRGFVEDVLVSRSHKSLEELGSCAKIGTCSPRRSAQLWHHYGIVSHPMRGNVPTRIERLQSCELDGLILARAGLERLNLSHWIHEALPPNVFVPAIGQGAIGLVCRASDHRLKQDLFALSDPDTFLCIQAERDFLARLWGSCASPIGGWAQRIDNTLIMQGYVADPQGKWQAYRQIECPIAQHQLAGSQLAEIIFSTTDYQPNAANSCPII